MRIPVLNLLPHFNAIDIETEIAESVHIETVADQTSSATVDKSVQGIDSNVKVLLLGVSSSGKSTLLEAMKLCCRYEYTADELKFFKEAVFRKLVWSMQKVLEVLRPMGHPFHNALESHARTILMQPVFMEVDFLQPEITDAIEILWGYLGALALYPQYIRNFHDYSASE